MVLWGLSYNKYLPCPILEHKLSFTAQPDLLCEP